MTRRTIFISDLHLSDATVQTTTLFLKFLDNIGKETDALYILGDLFQFWIGDDDRSTFNEQIKAALKNASNKIPIYLMPGNRDFLFGRVFALESGVTLLSDPYKIDLYGKKTLLTHGDILCTKDVEYHLLRNFIRFPYGIKIFLKLPLAIRLWFAKKVQKYIAKIKLSKAKEVLAIQTEDLKNLIHKFDSEQIIHGHVHMIEVEEFVIASKKVRRISLGEWNKQGSLLIYHDNHDFEFKTLG